MSKAIVIKETPIEGCFELIAKSHFDNRGSFTKIFHETDFLGSGLQTNFKESFFSFSKKSVLRGLHFQLPPDQHTKLVYCCRGSAQDCIVDLRIGSPTYGKHHSIILSPQSVTGLYIAEGIAHGFLALEEDVMMLYKTSSTHNPETDSGISWDSCSIKWQETSPIISERDRSFKSFHEFKSPFTYGK